MTKQNITKIKAHFCCSAGSIAAARKSQCASKQALKKKASKQKIAALWCPSVGRSGGPASLAQCTTVASKKENVILLKNNALITRPSSGRALLTPLPRNARDFRPVFCPYFCYWPAAARHPGFQPLSPPSNLHSPPVQLVPRRTLRSGSAGGGLVRLFLPRHPRLLWFFIQSTYKKTSVLWRSPLLLQTN